MDDKQLLINSFYKKLIYSFNELYKKAKEAHPDISKKYVKEWFDNQQTTQMTNKPVGKKEFLPIYSDAQYAFQIDLTFFPRYKKQNNNNTVLFTAININTRFAYAYYSKDKSMPTILDLLKKMESKTIINSITCDEGTEFKNIDFQEFCNKNDIQLYFVKGDGHKLGIINRFHRTLKEKLTQHFTAQDTVNWVDVIDDIIYNYNHSVNRGIGIEPYKVTTFIEQHIVESKKKETDLIESKEKSINIGDKCRLLVKKELFEDKMTPKYSNKVFTIIGLTKNSVIIEDSKGEEYKVKKRNIKIIKDVENHKELKEQKKANVSHTIERKLKKVDVDTTNILDNKRIKKKNTKYD